MRESGRPWACRIRIACSWRKCRRPYPGPPPEIGCVQQARATIVVQGSHRKFARSLAVGGLQFSITAPGVDRFCQLLNCPAIHHWIEHIPVTVLLSTKMWVVNRQGRIFHCRIFKIWTTGGWSSTFRVQNSDPVRIKGYWSGIRGGAMI